MSLQKIQLLLDSSDYIGCFETDGSSRYDMGNTNNMKPCECIGYCLTKNSTFAGITYGYKIKIKFLMVHNNFRDFCYCFEIPGKKINESYCNNNCTGDSLSKCGSSNKILNKSVYGTGRYVVVVLIWTNHTTLR